MLLHLNGPVYQPTFTSTRKDNLVQAFTIESALFGQPSQELYGWLIKPKEGLLDPHTTMLFLHGNAGNVITEYPVVLPFVEQGIQVFLFDYSGYGLSNGRATRKQVHQDAIAALEYLRSRQDVQGTKVVVYGQSLGGHTAALLAGERPALCDAVVIEGGFGAFREMAKRSVRFGSIAKLMVKEGPDAFEALGRYHGPLLLVHSTEDVVVPIDLGRELFNAGNEPKAWLEIDGPHANGPLLNSASIMQHVQLLLAR